MLERYRLGELSGADQARVAQALATDEALRARVQQLDLDDAATLAAHPPARIAAQVAARAVPPEDKRFRWLLPAFALAAAVTVTLVVQRAVVPDDVRFKGDGPSLRLFRLAAKEPERLADGAHVKPHDVVQVAFELSGAAHLVIVSVDGAGHATLHWPLDGNTAVPSGMKALPQAFELDEAPGFERFFLVTSEVPLSAPEVLAAAQGAARAGLLELPKTAAQRSLLLDKVSP
jgi:anti-sigma factor RsiW